MKQKNRLTLALLITSFVVLAVSGIYAAYDPNSPAQTHNALSDIDQIRENTNQLRKHESSGTTPSNLARGIIWDDSTNNLLKFYNGSIWQSVWDVANNRPAIASLTAAANKMPIADGSGILDASWGVGKAQTYTTNGTYTPPSGSSSALVLLVGGGGGGGGTGNSVGQAAGGGAAGGIKLVVVTGISGSVNITIGAGGTAGVGGGSPTAGGGGGTTSFGAYASASGGGGGPINGSGAAANSPYKTLGNNSYLDTFSGGPPSVSTDYGGAGRSGILGHGGDGGSNANGTSATGYGSGGGGGGGVQKNGGAGSGGLLVVWPL